MPHGPTLLLLLACSFTLAARAAEPAAATPQGPTQPAAPVHTPRPAPGDADDRTDPLTYSDSVRVTAEKWEADPAKVPLSLTVVTPDDLAASGAVLLNQVGPAVPGLFLRNDGDRSFNKPSLRGITSSPFNDPAVTVYVDDVPMDPRMGLATPLLDVEQIEVVRGPHGVVWGRNTSGGMMHVVTKLPGSTWTTTGGLSVGSFGEVVAPVSVQGPISDRVFLGVSGVYEYRNGFQSNAVNPNIVDSRNGAYGRVQLRWIPSATWDVQLRSDTGVWRDGAFLASANGAPRPYEVQSDTPSIEDSHVIQQSLRIRREGTHASMLLVAARRDVSVYRISDEDLMSRPVQEYTWSDLQDTRWNAELRVLAPAASKVRWLAGVYAGTRDARDAYETFLPIIFQGYSERNGAMYEDRTTAMFGQVQFPLGRRVHVTVGARADQDRKRMARADRLYGFPTPTPDDDFVAPGFTLTRSFTFVSPRVSLDVELTPSVMAFAGVARGARSGGFNFTTDSPPLAGFNGEYVRSVEGGVKVRSANGRADAAVSVYRSFISDLQFQQFVAGFFAVANAGEASARGVEIEGRLRLGNGLAVRGNYGVTSATLESFDNGVTNLSGNRIPAVPGYTFQAAADWKGRRGFEATLEVVGNGRIYFDEANISQADAYALVNLRAGLQRGHWGLHVYARNLTATDYTTMIVPMFYRVPGLPRRVGVMLSVGGR